MQFPGQYGPDGGMAIIANANVIMVNAVKDNDEKKPTFNAMIALLSASILLLLLS